MAKGESEASKLQRVQKSLALNSPKANRRRATRNGEWEASSKGEHVPESTRNHSPSTRPRRTKGKQLAMANEYDREAS